MSLYGAQLHEVSCTDSNFMHRQEHLLRHCLPLNDGLEQLQQQQQQQQHQWEQSQPEQQQHQQLQHQWQMSPSDDEVNLQQKQQTRHQQHSVKPYHHQQQQQQRDSSQADTTTTTSTATKQEDMNVSINLPSQPSSIYTIRSTKRQYSILLAASVISILVPFSDTVYLPALQVVQATLRTTQELVAASVSIYMFMVGAASLVWGPLADRFGRRLTYFAALAAFLGSTIVCMFAPTIGVLVAFRALQGAGVTALVTTGSGVLADIFPPEQRGRASGIFMIPLLIGPVIGPLLGGALSQYFGWRSCFIALAAFGGAIVLPLLVLVVPETHQWLVLQRMSLEQQSNIKEREAILSAPPVMNAPWVPLRYMLDCTIAPHAAVAFITFGCNFASLTELPGALSAAPYSLSAALLGVTYLADGVSGLAGSPVGGWVSDHAAAAHPTEPEARLMYNTLLTLLIMPSGLLIFAWSLHFKTKLVAVIVAQFLIGFACAVCLPGVLSYVTTVKQSAAAGAAAMVQAMMFIMAGVMILVSSVMVQQIGFGPWFSVLAGVEAVVAGFAYLKILSKKHAAAVAAAAASDEAAAG